MKLSGGGLLVLLVLALVFKVNPLALLEETGGLSGGQTTSSQPLTEEQERLAEFSSIILASTEDVWTEEFRSMGLEYQKPSMVLFTGSTRSGCGFASSQVGPFYCPADGKVYLYTHMLF